MVRQLAPVTTRLRIGLVIASALLALSPVVALATTTAYDLTLVGEATGRGAVGEKLLSDGITTHASAISTSGAGYPNPYAQLQWSGSQTLNSAELGGMTDGHYALKWSRRFAWGQVHFFSGPVNSQVVQGRPVQGINSSARVRIQGTGVPSTIATLAQFDQTSGGSNWFLGTAQTPRMRPPSAAGWTAYTPSALYVVDREYAAQSGVIRWDRAVGSGVVTVTATMFVGSAFGYGVRSDVVTQAAMSIQPLMIFEGQNDVFATGGDYVDGGATTVNYNTSQTGVQGVVTEDLTLQSTNDSSTAGTWMSHNTSDTLGYVSNGTSGTPNGEEGGGPPGLGILSGFWDSWLAWATTQLGTVTTPLTSWSHNMFWWLDAVSAIPSSGPAPQ
jgi:hypothetical protein